MTDILQPYKGVMTVSDTNDFCIMVRPSDEQQQRIEQIRGTRPGTSINCVNSGTTGKHPIYAVVSMIGPRERRAKALARTALWQTAQQKNLMWQNNGAMSCKFQCGIIVQGHDWQFTACVPDPYGCKMFFPPLKLGDTRTRLGLLSLLASLAVLQEDAQTRFWSAFKKDMLRMP